MSEPLRKIIHVDMDAFFAAVEQRDYPQYRNKPLIVGGRPDSRGVVATCSYEARKFGVHSAMPSAHAYRLCPQAIFVKPRFEVYRQVSEQIRRIFIRYCDCVEPLSLDEAYLDVSDSRRFQGSATWLAKQIKLDIQRETELTASAGVSYNKFLAKLASDLDKPDGLHVIMPEQAQNFIDRLPIGKFHGIGPATEKKMQALGITNGLTLKQTPLHVLQQHFGKAALHYYRIARGIDERIVNSHRERKSVGVEMTYQEDIDDAEVILEQLKLLLQQALQKLADNRLSAHTLTVKIKYQNFVQITRGRTLSEPVTDCNATYELMANLLSSTDFVGKKVRLLGVILSGLNNEPTVQAYRQLDLFNL
ncbi:MULTISPECIES: DNA polymerase IV [Methylomonas]|uniref:DNA polymerase IV n=1 Tax=Methylomonas TaxID=416 RepID=UPI001231BCD0|nr:DNA polymerase IV [Methylomonas rhizoryzae]